MDWDQFRFFLEVARCGTLHSAARRLGVDHTTVARRIQALEKEVGTPLFVREAAGHRTTEAGRRLLPEVEAMEAAFQAVEIAASPQPAGLSGTVRVGATEGFGATIVAPAMARMAQANPSLTVDLLALPRLVNLSRREADIVISLERPARGPVVVVKLTDYTLKLYASKAYLKAHAPIRTPADLQDHDFITYVDDQLFSKELQLLREVHTPDRFTFRSTSVFAQHQAVSAGAGLAVLPAFLADSDPGLVALLPKQARFTRTFWMSTPAEIKHLARIRAVSSLLRETVEAQRELLQPRD